MGRFCRNATCTKLPLRIRILTASLTPAEMARAALRCSSPAAVRSPAAYNETGFRLPLVLPMILPERVVRAVALSTAALMAAFVLLGARQVGQVGLFPGPFLDKIAHATYYGLMAMLVERGLGRRLPIVAIAVAIAVGAADEVHQIDVPLRTASVFDWMADIAGAVLFTLLWRAARRAGRRPA